MDAPVHIKQKGEWDCLFTCLMMFGISEKQLIKVCQEAVMEIFLPDVSLEVLDDKGNWNCVPGLSLISDPSIVFIRKLLDGKISRHVIVADWDEVLDPQLDGPLSRESWCRMMNADYDCYWTEAVIPWRDR